MATLEHWQNSLNEAQKTLDSFLTDSSQLAKCEKFSELLISAFKAGGTAFCCGNGGSHCDALHFAEEVTGRFRKDRKALGALALGNAPHVTCVANDYGFEHIFSRQLAGLGRAGDILIGLSTSGNSKNIYNAFEVAKDRDIQTVALLGKTGGKLKEMADLAIIIPGETSDRIQEMHIKLLHTVIETLERELFPENY